MNKKWFAALAVAALFSTAGAVAQEKKATTLQPQQQGNLKQGQVKRGQMFNKIDTDKDGKISKAEADAAPKDKFSQNFAVIDKNQDNYLDKEELKAYRKEKKAEKKQ